MSKKIRTAAAPAIVVAAKRFLEIRHEVKAFDRKALQRAILASANLSSIATDVDGVIRIFTAGAERMLGYPAAEVINRITPASLSDPEESVVRAKALSVELNKTIAPGFETLIAKASLGIEDNYELTWIRKDGSRLPAVVSATALRNDQGSIIGYLLIGADNSARKQAEEALRQSDERLRLLVLGFRDYAILMLDTEGRVVTWNESAERIKGYRSEEILGSHFSRFYTPEAIVQDMPAQQLKTATEKGRFEEEGWRVRKDGSQLWASVVIDALLDEGRPTPRFRHGYPGYRRTQALRRGAATGRCETATTGFRCQGLCNPDARSRGPGGHLEQRRGEHQRLSRG